MIDSNLLGVLLCVLFPAIGITVVAAVFGTRSRLNYAKRLLDAQARGAFKDMNTPQNTFRYRCLAFLALFGVLGMILSIASLILLQPSKIALYSLIIIAIFFCVLGLAAGLLMQREIDRRL